MTLRIKVFVDKLHTHGLCALVAALTGCGPSVTPASEAFRPGVPRIVSGETEFKEGIKALQHSTVVLTAPRPGDKISQSRPIECIVQLTVSVDKQVPDFINVELSQKGRTFDSCVPQPDRMLKKGIYQYRGSLKSPSKPGTYTLRVQGNNTFFIQDASAKGEPKTDVFRFFSNPTQITITK